MRIYLLDMGKTMYGDCVLIRRGTRSILIDGAHPGDAASIRSQLRRLLGGTPPFDIDLLVVTHCHNDHIGCLPALIAAGDLTVKTALVADERLGWGREADGAGPVDALRLLPSHQALVAALQEEDYSGLPQDELEEFLTEDVTLEEKYATMLQQLADQGTKVVRYGRAADSSVREIEEAFADFGLKVLGPTTDQLVLCAEAIARGTDALVATLAQQNVAAEADAAGMADVYRLLARRAADAEEMAADRWGLGAAKNGQSIVLKLEADGWSALLGGDMQLAEAEVPGLEPLVDALQRRVTEAGPYDFIKLSHHSSYNAVDDALLDQWSATRLFAHSGGRNDPSHPAEGVLRLLRNRRDSLTFARTDRNGIITVADRGGVEMKPSTGNLNDFGANPPRDEPQPSAPVGEEWRSETTVVPSGDSQTIEVIARVPRNAQGLKLTIQVESTGAQTTLAEPIVSGDLSTLQLAGNRPLPKLLFVTSSPRLEANLGRVEASQVLKGLGSVPSAQIVDLPAALQTAEQAADLVRPRLRAGEFAGVVLLGGYDVVPAQRLDVLDAALRKRVEDAGYGGQDADNFIVWSDDLYGDLDGDYLPELPVARIPDGRRPDVVRGVFRALRFTPGTRFGVRNVHRPFASTVFPLLPGGGGRLEVSEPFAPQDVVLGGATGAVYFMLHGSARDATRFWGETEGGAAYEAFAIENVPSKTLGAVVFAGCCWGALTTTTPAWRARPGTTVSPRGPETSLAVAYLQAGALAFVGCTGSHYSPLQAPYDYFGKPMHDAFWTALAQDRAPAEALFEAKKEFARHMPHGRTDPFSQAVEVKILRQFTCLGLAW